MEKTFDEMLALIREYARIKGATKNYMDLARPVHVLWMQNKEDPNWKLFKEWISPRSEMETASDCRQRIGKIFDSKKAIKPPKSIKALYPLAQVLGMSKLMLDPFKKSREAASVFGKIEDVFECPAKDPPEGASYRFLYTRPEEVDAQFILLDLAEGGSSESHWHVGDELLLCLSGKVEVFLPDSGTTYHIEEGGYVHFNSEEQHEVLNPIRTDKDLVSRDAKLLAIRLNQTHGGVRRKARNYLLDLSPEHLKDLCHWAKGELLEFGHSRFIGTDPNDSANEILDVIGLSNFFSHLKEKNWGDAPKIWEERVMCQILNGTYRKGVCLNKLKGYAKKLNLPESFLRPFTFPTSSCSISVNKTSKLFDAPREEDGGLAMYKVPQARLAASDVSVAYLSFSQKTKKPAYYPHPGIEVVIPLKGRIGLEIKKGNQRLQDKELAKGDIAIFDSSKAHRVYGVEEGDCEALIIRIYGY